MQEIDDLIDKLQKLNALISVMADKDQAHFKKRAVFQLERVDYAIEDLCFGALYCDLDQSKCDLAEQEAKTEKSIVKQLFPYYWALTDAAAKKN